MILYCERTGSGIKGIYWSKDILGDRDRADKQVVIIFTCNGAPLRDGSKRVSA